MTAAAEGGTRDCVCGVRFAAVFAESPLFGFCLCWSAPGPPCAFFSLFYCFRLKKEACSGVRRRRPRWWLIIQLMASARSEGTGASTRRSFRLTVPEARFATHDTGAGRFPTSPTRFSICPPRELLRLSASSTIAATCRHCLQTSDPRREKPCSRSLRRKGKPQPGAADNRFPEVSGTVRKTALLFFRCSRTE